MDSDIEQNFVCFLNGFFMAFGSDYGPKSLPKRSPGTIRLSSCFRAWNGFGKLLGALGSFWGPRNDFYRFLIDFWWNFDCFLVDFWTIFYFVWWFYNDFWWVFVVSLSSLLSFLIGFCCFIVIIVIVVIAIIVIIIVIIIIVILVMMKAVLGFAESRSISVHTLSAYIRISECLLRHTKRILL